MIPATARQISVLPTRKLTVGSAVAPIVSQFWHSFARQVADLHTTPGLRDALYDLAATPSAAVVVGMVVAMAAGWFMPDAPNIPQLSKG